MLKNILIYNFLRVLPFKIINYFKIYKFRLNITLDNLIKDGIEINTVYDIGAFHGEWSQFLNKTSLKNKKFYCFEANDAHEEIIKKKGFEYSIGVLSDKKKEVEFYSMNHSGDSYYLEQTNFYKKDIKAIKKITSTLDDIVNEKKFTLPDLIKIDTQGAEIDILKGASNTISKASLIYLECPIVKYNLNAPNFNDYINYLETINFLPYEICEIHYINKVLVQIDIIFIKKEKLNEIFQGKKILNLLNDI